MAKNIVIYDVIGKHCGMHYYDEAFANLLKTSDNSVEVMSNYPFQGSPAYLPNFFSIGILFRIVLMTWYAIKLFFTVIFSRNTIFIYLWYGEKYDLLFALCSLFSKNVWLDVHEVHALKYSDTSVISSFYCKYFKYIIKNVIYHSDRTKSFLAPYGINMLYVPHFKYGFQKDFNKANLTDEIKGCFKTNNCKFLFFGNLTIVKGVDTVVDVFNKINEDGIQFELVIAGKNVANFDFDSLMHCKNTIIIDRHITDDELVYLYSNTDYVLLPYKKSSQSGILEMSAYFKKPMLLSDIPYFKEIIKEYPSFGIIAPLSNFESLVTKVITDTSTYFSQSDCDKFEMKELYDKFKIEFYKAIY